MDVLLDVDTGVDDALAILFAVRHPGLRVRAITCVAGNTHVDQVVRNTLRILDAAGAPDDLAVARGASRPLLEPHRDARSVHGSDGMADIGLPDSARTPVPRHAVELMREQILAAPRPVTLISLAPMTNIALLLRTHPDVAANIERLMVMGGSATVGNATPVAEFNVWHDPEAAAIVFGGDVPVTMYGLDVFYGATVSRAQAENLCRSADPGARAAGRLLIHASDRYGTDHRIPEPGAAGLGDAGAVCAVADPKGLRTERRPVRVELAGGTRGQTVVDRRSIPGEDEQHGTGMSTAPADVALGIDGERYRRLFLATIGD